LLDEILEHLAQLAGAVARLDTGQGAVLEEVRDALADVADAPMDYVLFLEEEGHMVFDRDAGTLSLTDAGREALNDPEQWRYGAEDAFGDALGPDDATSIVGSDAFFVDESMLTGEDAPVESVDPSTQPELSVLPESLATDASIEAPFETPANIEVPEEIVQMGIPDDARITQEDVAYSVHDEEEQSVEEEPEAPQEREKAPPASTAFTQGKPMSGGIPRYDRGEEIGSGGIGTVYRGVQRNLDRPVAIKEIRQIFDVFANVERSVIVERFQRVTTTQSRLTHANIVQLIDIDSDAEFPFAVMGLASNGNLRRVIGGERPPLQVALKYFLQILHALNSAHDQKIYHGSVKPENVVIDGSGNALLTDFGVGQIAERDASNSSHVYIGVGTVAYMSPEQFRDPNMATAKSDIYSLGIMFYELLTGKVPGRRSPMPSSFYPDIPRKLDDIFDRMSMDDEGDRFDSIDAILSDLYGSKEVMKILDKRGGVLFLRDPMQFGADGLGGSAPAAPAEDSVAEEEAEAFAPEEVSEADAAEEASSAPAEEEGEAEAADDDGGDGEDGDVLDKLDKYGELFEDEE
jgi:hypothetical protein